MESQKANDTCVESPQVEKLQEQFMTLQQEWESYKQSNPKTKRRSCSTNSSFSRAMSKTLDQLLDNSPRHLMSSLQQRMSPPDSDVWNVRTNDLAGEEIRRDRRAAIESGKLKGRRLFEDENENEDTDIGFGQEECEWDQETEVRSVPFYVSDDDEEKESGKSIEIEVCFQDSISSSTSVKRMNEEDEKQVVKNKESNWIRFIAVIMPVLAIAAVVFAICSIRGLYGYGKENYEQVLVPT